MERSVSVKKAINMNIICSGNIYRTYGSVVGWPVDTYYKHDLYQVWNRDIFISLGAPLLIKFRCNIGQRTPHEYMEFIVDLYDKSGAEFYALAIDSEHWNFMVYDKYGRTINITTGVEAKSLYSLVTGPFY